MTPTYSIGSVRRVVHRVRALLLRRVSVAAVLWTLAAGMAVLLAAWMAHGGTGWRVGNPWPLVLDVTLALAVVAAVLAVRRGFSTWADQPRVAEAVEEAADLKEGAVRGTLEIEEHLPWGASRSLALEAGREAFGFLHRDPAELTGRLGREANRWIRRGAGALAVLLPTVVLLAVLSPERTVGAWSGLVQPVRVLTGSNLAPITVDPGTVSVPRGSPVEVRVTAPGREEVVLHLRRAGQLPVTRSAIVSGDSEARFLLESVAVRTEYWAEGSDGSRTDEYTLTPTDPLLVTDLTVEATFPDHTGRFPEEYRSEVPQLTLPIGTRLRIYGRASRRLSQAFLGHQETGVEISLEVQGSSFSGDWWPVRGGTYTWGFEDPDGALPELAPDPLRIVMVRDSVPELEVVFPGADTIMPLSMQQPLVVDARDDYGLTDLSVEITRPGESPQSDTQVIPLENAPAVEARPILDLRDWSLLPGDSVLYTVQVRDNAAEPQVTRSRTFVLHVPSVSELRRTAEDELEAAAERMRELADRAAEQAERSRQLDRAAEGGDRNGELSFEEREEMRQALEGQRAMTEEVAELQRELERLAEALEEGGAADPELQKDFEELQELLEQLGGDDLAEQLDRMQQSLDEMDAQRSREELSQLAEQQEEFRRLLEESIERFRRAAVEQEFRATKDEAEELAQKERALAEALKEADDPALREEQQRELADDAEALREQIERLAEQLEQLEEQQAADDVRQAGQQAEQAQDRMQQAAERAQQSPQEAGETAEDAAEMMQQISQQLNQAQQDMAERMAEQVQGALEQAADDALALAEREVELREQMRGASRDELAEMRAEQSAISEGAENVMEQLSQSTRGAPEAAAQISELARQAAEQAQRTGEAIEGRSGAAPSPAAEAERTIEALNQLALGAAGAAQAMSQPQGDPSSGEQVQEALQQLAQEQSSVMNQSQQLMPMQLGQEAMSQAMQEVAQGQQSVAGELGDLADQPGASEETLGDLEALEQEAIAIAEALRDGRLDREMLDRQERLFHRLLDAGRSLEQEEEDESEERESETASEYEVRIVDPLSEDALARPRFELPSAAVLSRLSPAERRLVLQYFERLNRRPSATQPPGGEGERP